MQPPPDCLHRGPPAGRQIGAPGALRLVQDLYPCTLHGAVTASQCVSCPDVAVPRPLEARTPRRERKQPQGILTTPDGLDARLEGVLKGRAAFLVLSGPSLASLDLAALGQRGVVSMGVNNSSAVVRTSYWTHVDPASKFHHGIWRDPGVVKLTPARRIATPNLREKEGGRFRDTGQSPAQMPWTFGYARNARFRPERWLWEKSANWGNDKRWAAKNGHPHVLNVMLASLRLVHHLGARRVFLLGCDWRMDDRRPYAFAQGKRGAAASSNNASYAKVAHLLGLLKPHFVRAGFEVYNCNRASHLTVFPYCPYKEAIEDATRGVPRTLDTEGWYDRREGAGEVDPREARGGP